MHPNELNLQTMVVFLQTRQMKRPAGKTDQVLKLVKNQKKLFRRILERERTKESDGEGVKDRERERERGGEEEKEKERGNN